MNFNNPFSEKGLLFQVPGLNILLKRLVLRGINTVLLPDIVG